MQGYRIHVEIEVAPCATWIPDEPMHVHTDKRKTACAHMRISCCRRDADTLMRTSDGGHEDDDHEVLQDGRCDA